MGFPYRIFLAAHGVDFEIKTSGHISELPKKNINFEMWSNPSFYSLLCTILSVLSPSEASQQLREEVPKLLIERSFVFYSMTAPLLRETKRLLCADLIKYECSYANMSLNVY